MVTRLGGSAISSPTILRNILPALEPEAKVKVIYLDGSGTRRKATVTLASGLPQ